MDGGAWWAAVRGVAKSRTWLSDFTFTFHVPALEKEMATHSSVLVWRIPGTGEPGGLPSMGSHRVGHDRSSFSLGRSEGRTWQAKEHPWKPVLFFYYCLSSWTPLVLWSAWFSFAESCFSIFYQKDVCDLKKVEPQSGMITLTFLYISSLSLELRNGQQNSVCLQWLIYLLCIFYSRTYIYVCVSTHTHTHTQNIYIYIPKSAQIISFH